MGQRNERVAHELAAACRLQQFHRASLEWLLHAALDVSSSARARARAAVGRFLRPHPAFYEVVVNCARKHDSSCWPQLFGICGQPDTLFDACVQHRRFHIASRYLIIIQVMVSIGKARALAWRLLHALPLELPTNSKKAVSKQQPQQRRASIVGSHKQQRRLQSLARQLVKFLTRTEHEAAACAGEEGQDSQQREETKLPSASTAPAASPAAAELGPKRVSSSSLSIVASPDVSFVSPSRVVIHAPSPLSVVTPQARLRLDGVRRPQRRVYSSSALSASSSSSHRGGHLRKVRRKQVLLGAYNKQQNGDDNESSCSIM
jgi:hypothetical protein